MEYFTLNNIFLYLSKESKVNGIILDSRAKLITGEKIGADDDMKYIEIYSRNKKN